MTADEVIQAVVETLDRAIDADIVYVHATASGGSHAAIVKVGTPAYNAMALAYPGLPPHEHIEPGVF